jgi:hypothetical protein
MVPARGRSTAKRPPTPGRRFHAATLGSRVPAGSSWPVGPEATPRAEADSQPNVPGATPEVVIVP